MRSEIEIYLLLLSLERSQTFVVVHSVTSERSRSDDEADQTCVANLTKRHNSKIVVGSTEILEHFIR